MKPNLFLEHELAAWRHLGFRNLGNNSSAARYNNHQTCVFLQKALHARVNAQRCNEVCCYLRMAVVKPSIGMGLRFANPIHLKITTHSKRPNFLRLQVQHSRSWQRPYSVIPNYSIETCLVSTFSDPRPRATPAV